MGLVGVILCGGRSSRMGEDKGLLRIGEKVWAEHAKEKLEGVCAGVYISINESQAREYSKYFAREELLLDEESYKGPHGGILSVNKTLEEKEGAIEEGGYWLYVLACDMLEVREVLIDRLYKRWIRYGNNYDVYVYRCANNVEGLCGIYSRAYLSRTKREGSSVKKLVAGGRGNIEELGEQESKWFYSINTKSDYDRLGKK